MPRPWSDAQAHTRRYCADVGAVDQRAQLAAFTVINDGARDRRFAFGQDRGAGFDFELLQASR